ncbi:flagellar biosynthesis protein FliZ [Borrelia sp. A-FGy1]|uniref:flagellar biosynthesis protein FliZ n=1 Tax=Borrelia sp. A-FGy1 TaxID=2608247 RepID=UPI001E3C993E|nr:flagellar biosynthesis protein FliZ [Borrelia sp. A-FGy1]
MFLGFLLFFKILFAQEEVNLEDISYDVKNEKDLPIFGDDDTKLNNNIKNVSLFDIADLVKILLFLSFFIFFIFLFKRVLFKYKRVRNNNIKSDYIKELVFYEIDAKNSIRIINILGNVYIFLLSANFSILLREIKQGEELNNLEFELVKDKDLNNENSFKTIINKILNKTRKEDEELLEKANYIELEKDIEISLKSKQDRLKKF